MTNLRPLVSRRSLFVFSLLALLHVSSASAHFLWMSVDERSGAPRLTFGETPDEETPEKLVARLVEAKARDENGAPVALTQTGAAWVGATSKQVAGATQHWGVVDRSGDGSGVFLLDYFAKGGKHLEDTTRDLKLPLELFARAEAGQIVATLRRGAERVAKSPVHINLPSGRSLERETDAQGEIRFDREGAGLYGIRARWLDPRKGEENGKPYGDARHYTTLTFAIADGAAEPATPATADPIAYGLLKKAHDSRQVMPPDFRGFQSELIFQQADKVFRGELVYRREGGETEIRLPGADEASLAWARRQVLNVVGHRRGGDFAEGDGRYPLKLGPDDGSPYGRLILVHDATDSSYRVRDNRVTEVTRTMDGSRFTISVIETMDADDGKYIANHFIVAYRDPATSALQKFEGYRDSYSRVGGVWLPTSRTIIEVSDATSPIVRTLRFRKVEPLAETTTAEKAAALQPEAKMP